MRTNRAWTSPGSNLLSRRRLFGTATAGSAAFAALLAAACGGSDSDDSAGQGAQRTGAIDTPIAGREKLDATLTSGVGSDAGSMDPQSLAGTGGGNWPNYAVHFTQPLTIDQKTSEVKPFAADWRWTDNNAALILTVKPGVKFHNGEALNAEQIKFNIDRELGRAAYNPAYKSGHKAQFEAVGETSVVDENTLRIEMLRPDVILPTKIASTLYLVPQKYVTRIGDDEFASKPVGSGPFKFVSRVPDSEIRSARFDEFFNGRDAAYGPRLPYVANLIQKVIPENTARTAALDAGEIDIAHNVSADLAKSYEGRSGYKVFYLLGDQPMHIHINTVVERDPATGRPNPWVDLRVRKAANLAIDLDTIIKTILTGKEKPSFGSAQQSFGFPDGVEQKRFRHDPKEAKRLLTEAGYPDGFDTNFYGAIGRWPNTDDVMQAVAGYLKEVGIRTKIQMQQYQVTTTELKQHGNYGLTFWGMSGGSDPGPNFQYGYYSKGAYTNSYDPVLGLDPLIIQSETAFDATERKKLIGEIISKFYENASWIFLYEPVTVAVAKEKVNWPFYNEVLSTIEYWNVRVTG